jgi:O-antigen/teichoic acid export membrane protein
VITAFFKDSALYGVSALLAKSISFLLLPFYARFFAPEEYGVIDYLNVIGLFIGVLIALEISQGVARYVAEAKDDLVARKLYASTAMWFTLVMYGAFCLFIFTFSKPITTIVFDDDRYSDLLIIASFSFLFTAALYLIQNQLRWELRPKEYAALSILYALLVLIFSVLFIAFLKLNITGVFYAYICANIICLVLGLYWTRKSFGLCFSSDYLREMLHFSCPLVLSSFAVIGSMFADRFLIKELLTLEDVGYYAVGYRIAMIVSFVMVGFQGAITPLIYSNYQNSETPVQISKIFRYFLCFSCLILFFIICFQYYLVFVLAGSKYLLSMQVIPFLALSSLFSTMYIFAPGLSIAKKTHIISFINLAGFMLNIVLNLLLIPEWGISGAAFATCLSSAFIFGFMVFYGQRYYNIPHHYRLYAGLALIVTGLIMGSALLPSLFYYSFYVSFMLLVISVGLLWNIGIVSRNEIQSALVFVREVKKTKINRAKKNVRD